MNMHNIVLGYDDFIRLFNVTDPQDFAPGLVVRTDGVYVIPPPDDVDLTPEERASLTAHPTGNLREPALPLPCRLADVEAFADFYSLHCAIEPFMMLKIVNKLTWAHAQIDFQSKQGFIRNFLPGLMDLRKNLKRQHEVESNDSKKVVQRAILDELNGLLAPIDNADGDRVSRASGAAPNEAKPLHVKRENTYLRLIGALAKAAGIDISEGEQGAALIAAAVRDAKLKGPDERAIRNILIEVREQF